MGVKDILHDREVLTRLNAFLVIYFGWIVFGLIYPIIGKYSVDLTTQFLKLPFTSYAFVSGLLTFAKSHVLLYYSMRAIYFVGFSGSIALTVAFLLLYKKDFRASDELFIRYLGLYTVSGAIYCIFHIYAPHVVYNLPVKSLTGTYLTQQEFVLPSLHNAIATANAVTLWKHRKDPIAKVIIFLNMMVPVVTLFLGHHWIYDIITGIVLALIISKLTEGYKLKVPSSLRSIQISDLRKITAFSIIFATIVLIIAANPSLYSSLLQRLLGTP
ncbi:phosphatase PAP2 family protein [Thermococcus sp.]